LPATVPVPAAAPGPDLPPATALVLAPIFALVPQPLLLRVPVSTMALGLARLPALGLLLAPIRPATNGLARPGEVVALYRCAQPSAPE
jgi:hypothetical protein